jgi:hypothetical protein
LKREATLGQERISGRKDARVSRLVEIQTARVITWEQSKRLEDDRGIDIEEPQRFAPASTVDVHGDGQECFDEDGVASDTGLGASVVHVLATAKGIDRDQDERGRRDHRHREHAAAWPIACVPESEP